MDKRAARNLIFVLLVLGWVTAATAAGLASSPVSLLELPWVQMLVGCLIALWGGLARTAARVLTLGGERISLWREVVKDIFASSLVGFIVFSVSAWQSWDVWMLAVVLPLAGYGGARFLEPLSDAVVARAAALIAKGEQP